MDVPIVAQSTSPAQASTPDQPDELLALAVELQHEEDLSAIEALTHAAALLDEVHIFAVIWDLSTNVTCLVPDLGAPTSPIIRFDLGAVVATPSALEALATSKRTPAEFLNRHANGDWGDLDDGDRQANDQALRRGGRLLSSYHLDADTTLWIITEADRSATTLLLPSDY